MNFWQVCGLIFGGAWLFITLWAIIGAGVPLLRHKRAERRRDRHDEV